MGKKGDFSWAQIVAPSGVRKMNYHFCATVASPHPCRSGSVSGHDILPSGEPACTESSHQESCSDGRDLTQEGAPTPVSEPRCDSFT